MLRRDASFQPFAHFLPLSASFHVSYYAIPYARRQLFVGIPVLGKGKGHLPRLGTNNRILQRITVEEN